MPEPLINTGPWCVVSIFTRPNLSNGKMSTIVNVYAANDRNHALRIRHRMLKNFKEQGYPESCKLDVRPKRAWPVGLLGDPS